MGKSGNKQRENHILDVAADLFIRYGFDKTAVSDIARAAGVSQGTIYLHFASKDAMFEAMLIREMIAYADRWLELIDKDQDGGTIGWMYKHSLYALNTSPFMSAMIRQDGRILGSYLRRPDTFLRDRSRVSNRYEFVRLLQEAGAIRDDISHEVVAHIMTMLSYGLVGMGDIMDTADMPPAEAVIEGMAIIMDRALTPENGGDPLAFKAILRQYTDAARQQLEIVRNPSQEKIDEP